MAAHDKEERQEAADAATQGNATEQPTPCSAWARIEEADFDQTGFAYTLSLIQGKYKMVILYCLMEFQPVRFNELRRYLKTVSDKTLSRALKELEADGLISRKAYPQIPPKVEYRLTERGASLMEVLDAMCVWGTEHRDLRRP